MVKGSLIRWPMEFLGLGKGGLRFEELVSWPQRMGDRADVAISPPGL